MTPSYRRRLYREFAIGLLMAAAGIWAVLWEYHWLFIAIGVIAPLAYFVILAMQIAMSRCPRCRALVDLRADGDAKCPKCGVWLRSDSESEELDEDDAAVQQDTVVRFTSHLGNSFVAPSRWTMTEKGDTFLLKSPDGQAIIHAITFTSQGSGSLEQFRETMALGLLPDGATGWMPSDWAAIKIGDAEAHKRELIPAPEADQHWRLYVLDGGKWYHAIILNASNEALLLNGDFYENIVRTFTAMRK